MGAFALAISAGIIFNLLVNCQLPNSRRDTRQKPCPTLTSPDVTLNESHVMLRVVAPVAAVVAPIAAAAVADPAWDVFMSELKQDLHNMNMVQKEQSLEKLIRTSSPKHELCARFPLKPIPIVIETNTGVCMLGSHLTKGTVCENAIRGKSSWTPDPHVRDVITTVLLKCGFRSESDTCFAVDVGSNVGAHTLVMLQLGARVVAIEPQMDFCIATRTAAAASGWENRSHVVCGGLAGHQTDSQDAMLPVDATNWRYEGKLSEMPYKLDAVPLVALDRLIRSHSAVDFLKIDTDSIDCLVLQQAIDLMDSRGLKIRGMMLETWDGSCKNSNLIGKQMLKLAKMGYSIYRTMVYERSFDEHHRDYENDFRAVTLPNGWTEEFHVGFNFVLWRFNTESMSDDDVAGHPQKHPDWQYVFTKGVDVAQAGYKAKEL